MDTFKNTMPLIAKVYSGESTKITSTMLEKERHGLLQNERFNMQVKIEWQNDEN